MSGQVTRSGTLFVPGGRLSVRDGVTPTDMRSVFGKPNRGKAPDGKTTATWHFNTPHGRVSVYDFWDNPGNMSIGGTDHKAADCLHSFLDEMGLGQRGQDSEEREPFF